MTARPRVLHLVVAGDVGGAERLLVDLASHPDESGADHEVAVMTPNRALVGFLGQASLRLHDRGPVRENPLAYLWRSLGPSDLAWLTNLLQQIQADVVHTHTFASHVLGTRAARRAGLPQVRTEHHVMHYFDPSCSPFTRWAAHRTDRLVAVSDYVARVVGQTAPALAARTRVVRNGVDVAYWSPRPRRREDGPLRLGIVCRLTAWKRVEWAIEAAARAEWELVVVGDGEERARLEKLARQSGGAVTFAGYQRDPRPHVSACDATLSTARDEPLGLSVLESLALERPVIAFAGGGIPEIVQHESTGYLVAEPTVDALAATLALARLQQDGLAEMGRRGRRFVVDSCSLERMCQGYAAVYRELLGRAPGHHDKS